MVPGSSTWICTRTTPRKSTARKLERAGLIEKVHMGGRCMGMVVLQASSVRVLGPYDRDLVMERGGLCAIDGSWNLQHTYSGLSFPYGRRLPPGLVPVNPVNYGKVGRLSTSEAMAGALLIIGLERQAMELLSRLKWGPYFYEMNSPRSWRSTEGAGTRPRS
ncbi:DUF367 domain-containing protein [Thermogymnomonas acidicola]|uniref:ribosome biogenesis domain-containing protein n=1 Tax=Thermogymnomonas acidicola TaxID=399579 RepID=UPI001396BC76|nr:DUF367 domain-containing protein [Thermogymnomonas acidicola]